MKKTKHLFLIDPLEKLNIYKDSTLFLMANLQKEGKEVFSFFSKNLFFENSLLQEQYLTCFAFESKFNEENLEVTSFILQEEKKIKLNSDVVIHMRLDPPFDESYLKRCWILAALEEKYNVKIINSPKGIIQFNEKLSAYSLKNFSLSTFVGEKGDDFESFIHQQKEKKKKFIIVKPLNAFQGDGVFKIDLFNSEELEEILKTINDSFIAQEYEEEIIKGEVRAIFFKGEHLGSILKRPKEGGFLANIAQGSSYEKIQLTKNQLIECQKICQRLDKLGLPWPAFDLIGDNITEINVTCPGLLVEVSRAHGRNFCLRMIELLEK